MGSGSRRCFLSVPRVLSTGSPLGESSLRTRRCPKLGSPRLSGSSTASPMSAQVTGLQALAGTPQWAAPGPGPGVLPLLPSRAQLVMAGVESRSFYLPPFCRVRCSAHHHVLPAGVPEEGRPWFTLYPMTSGRDQ